jgi:hypothetical protein
VHLRRALLLFAIVLGLAAIAASVSRPRNTDDPLRGTPPATEAERQPSAAPGDSAPTDSSLTDSAPGAVELTFFASNPHPQQIQAGQAATVFVDVEEPGQVEIADLGMSAAAEPLTPARFDVLTRETGRHPITFTPAGADPVQERVGTLVVAAAQ